MPIKKITFPFFIWSILLLGASCTDSTKEIKLEKNEQIVDVNDIEIFVCVQMQQFILSECFRGNEKLYDLKEMAMDRSNPEMSKKAKNILKNVEKIDLEMNAFLAKVSAIKIKLSATSKAENELWVANEVSKPAFFTIEVLKGKKITLTQKMASDYSILKTSILEFRKVAMENVMNTNYNGSVINFVDPMIDTGVSLEESRNILQASMDKGNVPEEDREAMIKIYQDLTMLASVSPQNVNSPAEFLSLILALEKGMFSARASAYSQARWRLGGSSLMVDKLAVFVESPGQCFEGEEITVKTVIGAYSQSFNPKATINTASKTAIKQGIVSHKIKPQKSELLTLEGTVTTLNKSGLPITLPWKRTIKVLPK